MARSLIIGNGRPYNIAGHKFIWPFVLSCNQGWGVIPCGRLKDRIPLVLNIGRFQLRILRPLRMGGSHRTISFHVQWKWCLPESVSYRMDELEIIHAEYESQGEISFCWRWDMTSKYWKRGY